MQPRGIHFPVAITGSTTFDTYSFDFDWVSSPFISLERINCDGFGVRGSYWHIESTGRAAPDIVTAATPLFLMNLKTDVIDLEVTQDIDFGFASLVYTTGMRYLATKRTTDRPNISLRTPAFEGIGPTVSYEFRRRFAAWSVFHSLQASLIYGRETHVILAPGGVLDRQQGDTFIPAGSVEAGVEFDEVGGWPATARASCFAAGFRGVAYMGMHLQLSLNW